MLQKLALAAFSVWHSSHFRVIWLARDLPLRFRGRTLPVDGEVAHRWGELTADGRRIGRPLPVIDGLLLATASAHNLTFVTRNLRDCGDRGVPVLDPWG